MYFQALEKKKKKKTTKIRYTVDNRSCAFNDFSSLYADVTFALLISFIDS